MHPSLNIVLDNHTIDTGRSGSGRDIAILIQGGVGALAVEALAGLSFATASVRVL